MSEPPKGLAPNFLEEQDTGTPLQKRSIARNIQEPYAELRNELENEESASATPDKGNT